MNLNQEQLERDRVKAAFAYLVKRGLLRDNGQRRDGEVVYELAPYDGLTPELQAEYNDYAKGWAN